MRRLGSFLCGVIGVSVSAATYQVPVIDFRVQKHYDISSSLMTRDIAMPEYIGGSVMRFLMAPTPALPVSAKLDATVRLPQGASIRSMTCVVKDSDTAADFHSDSQVFLRRAKLDDESGPALVVQLPVGTTAAPGLVSRSAVPVSLDLRTVDNEVFSYVASADLKISAIPAEFFGLLFRGCKIEYDPRR